MAGKLTVERLGEVVRYEPGTGRFFDRESGREIVGAMAKRDGYRQIVVDRQNCVSRRMAWALTHGEWPNNEVGYLESSLSFPERDRLDNLATTAVDEEITAEQARTILAYDPESGILRWKTPRRGVKVGARAGSVDGNGYRYIPIRKKWYLAQRLAWLHAKGVWPKKLLRFVNDDTDDCRIDNLRETEFDYSTKEGRNEADRDRRKRRPQVYRQQDLRKNFGIDLAQYQAMHDAQDGKCAICRQPETATRDGTVKWLAVDHCHNSKAIRQLLCAACNMMLGMAQDDPARLRAAAAYIDQHAALAAEEAA